MIMNVCGSLAWQAFVAWLGRVEIMQAWGGVASRAEVLRVWIASVAGLGGMARQSRDCAGLYRLEGRGLTGWMSCRLAKAWGHGLVEQRSCVC
jgi:hypothetical protein